MLEDLELSLRTFVMAHRHWAGPVVFGLAFGESLAFVGMLLPATTILVFVGVMIGQGTLDFWWIVLWAVPGAALGDWLSYWIGRRFRHSIAGLWPFSSHPATLAHGYAFFARWGVASVFLGRFFGPVRAAIPLVAGIMDMRSTPFQIANWASAVIWAPSLLIVGMIGDVVYVRLREWTSGWAALAILIGLCTIGGFVCRHLVARRRATRN